MDAVTLPLAFFAGIAAFASPCFLPLVPALLAYLAGHSQTVSPSLATVAALPEQGFIRAKRVSHHRNVNTNVSSKSVYAALHAALFVAAFTTSFIAMWAVAALLGTGMGRLSEALRIVGGTSLILLAVHGLGWIRLSALNRTLRFSPGTQGNASCMRSFVMGCAFAFGWSPCIGPILATIIALALSTATMWQGFTLMFVFCLGMGLPIVALALGIDTVTKYLRALKGWQRTIQIGANILMLMVGVLMLANLLAPLSAVNWIA